MMNKGKVRIITEWDHNEEEWHTFSPDLPNVHGWGKTRYQAIRRFLGRFRSLFREEEYRFDNRPCTMLFKRRPEVVEAIQWDGTEEVFGVLKSWLASEKVSVMLVEKKLWITITEGVQHRIFPVDVEKWIVKHKDGKLEIFDNETFNNMYEGVEE